MNFLSLLINSDRKLNIPHIHSPIDDICEGYEDLYEDDDFLEVLKMSPEEVKAEICSHNEDPDEVLARIKGRLDNIVIPLKNKEDNNKIDTENVFNLLFNLVNEKITNDIFSNKVKDKSKKKVRNIYLIGAVPAAIIAVFSTILIMESNIVASSSELDNKHYFSGFVNKYIPDHIDNTTETPKYFSQLAGISLSEIREYSINDKNKKQLLLASNLDNNDYYFLKKELDNKKIAENYFSNYSSIQYINDDYKNENNYTKISFLGEEITDSVEKKTSDDKTFSVSLISNDSIFSISNKYKFHIDSMIAVEKLPVLISGNKVIITLANNRLVKIGYIGKNGNISEIEFNGDEIKKLDERQYYTSGVFKIFGSMEEGQNIYSLVHNSKYFKNGKNIEMANIISSEIGRHIENKNPNITFDKINKNSSYLFYVDIGIDPETKKISSVVEVKTADIKYTGKKLLI